MHDVESNGARIPAFGLGTWDIRGDMCAEIVAEVWSTHDDEVTLANDPFRQE